MLLELLELKPRELEEGFETELLLLLAELDEKAFELLDLEEALEDLLEEDLLELAFLADKLELFCEETGFFEANLATIIFDLLRAVWHLPSDTLSQPFHLSNL